MVFYLANASHPKSCRDRRASILNLGTAGVWWSGAPPRKRSRLVLYNRSRMMPLYFACKKSMGPVRASWLRFVLSRSSFGCLFLLVKSPVLQELSSCWPKLFSLCVKILSQLSSYQVVFLLFQCLSMIVTPPNKKFEAGRARRNYKNTPQAKHTKSVAKRIFAFLQKSVASRFAPGGRAVAHLPGP